NIAVRLFGMRPFELLDDAGLENLRRLDQLATRLSTATSPYAGGVVKAIEIGPGADRVLISDFGDHLVIFVRRLFREAPRRSLEVHADGTIVLPSRRRLGGKEQKIRCTSRFGVTAIGDYIRFADATGEDLGSLSIPWITPEDRRELVAIIGRQIDPEAAPPP
ncbi:MAG: hypothetical protein AAGC55_32600, partial [Myxococcota bacterium]